MVPMTEASLILQVLPSPKVQTPSCTAWPWPRRWYWCTASHTLRPAHRAVMCVAVRNTTCGGAVGGRGAPVVGVQISRTLQMCRRHERSPMVTSESLAGHASTMPCASRTRRSMSVFQTMLNAAPMTGRGAKPQRSCGKRTEARLTANMMARRARRSQARHCARDTARARRRDHARPRQFEARRRNRSVTRGGATMAAMTRPAAALAISKSMLLTCVRRVLRGKACLATVSATRPARERVMVAWRPPVTNCGAGGP